MDEILFKINLEKWVIFTDWESDAWSIPGISKGIKQD